MLQKFACRLIRWSIRTWRIQRSPAVRTPKLAISTSLTTRGPIRSMLGSGTFSSLRHKLADSQKFRASLRKQLSAGRRQKEKKACLDCCDPKICRADRLRRDGRAEARAKAWSKAGKQQQRELRTKPSCRVKVAPEAIERINNAVRIAAQNGHHRLQVITFIELL